MSFGREATLEATAIGLGAVTWSFNPPRNISVPRWVTEALSYPSLQTWGDEIRSPADWG
ncbi:MAG: hypothetical protein ACRC8Y_09605 [Chroococcales cyanobacterium]